jgi:hypothetical protein
MTQQEAKALAVARWGRDAVMTATPQGDTTEYVIGYMLDETDFYPVGAGASRAEAAHRAGLTHASTPAPGVVVPPVEAHPKGADARYVSRWFAWRAAHVGALIAAALTPGAAGDQPTAQQGQPAAPGDGTDGGMVTRRAHLRARAAALAALVVGPRAARALPARPTGRTSSRTNWSWQFPAGDTPFRLCEVTSTAGRATATFAVDEAELTDARAHGRAPRGPPDLRGPWGTLRCDDMPADALADLVAAVLAVQAEARAAHLLPPPPSRIFDRCTIAHGGRIIPRLAELVAQEPAAPLPLRAM